MNKTSLLIPIGSIWCFFFCIAISSCSRPEQPRPAPSPAFYHWKTQLQLTQAERTYLDSIGANKLYVKFFDVDWDASTSQPVPLATIEMDTSRLSGITIVPAVFITNRTLLNLPMPQVDTLAELIFKKILSLEYRLPQEVQFDCDWTPQTQVKYFALLASFRLHCSRHPSTATRPPSLSATIRLHQLKYFEKTGVPPVDRGMLMCYNMGDLEDWETENSILDLAATKTYLPENASVKYPIPLDFALPLFRWGVLFRDGRLIKLLNDLGAADLQDTSRFTKIATNRYVATKSTYLRAHYLYEGDQLRLEGVSSEALQELAKLLGGSSSDNPITVSFYHLDTSVMHLFPKEKIREALRQF